MHGLRLIPRSCSFKLAVLDTQVTLTGVGALTMQTTLVITETVGRTRSTGGLSTVGKSEGMGVDGGGTEHRRMIQAQQAQHCRLLTQHKKQHQTTEEGEEAGDEGSHGTTS
jgi:hypothetical protein